MTDPFRPLAESWAGIGKQLAAYSEVWRAAIVRNAEGTYVAHDYLVDLETLWGMSLRDAARVAATCVDLIAPIVANVTSEPGS